MPVAYVQLKSGACVSPNELLEFAQKNIPERAAWPKAVRVVEKLPTTNVGKIFKPDLQRLEIEDIVRAEAAGTGAGVSDIGFRQDPTRGLTVCVKASQGRDRLEEALAKYGFPSEVST